MNACAVRGSSTGRRRPPPSPGRGVVVPLDRAAIQRALAGRQRYKYVQPRVEREGDGWKIVSPNCSRNIDPAGGEVDVAWLLREGQGWNLYARDHAAGVWSLKLQGVRLSDALRRICEDAQREFWQ